MFTRDKFSDPARIFVVSIGQFHVIRLLRVESQSKAAQRVLQQVQFKS